MENLIVVSWIVLYVGWYALGRNPKRSIPRAAFAKLWPVPQVGELPAHFQLRQASYAFGWVSHTSGVCFLSIKMADLFPDLGMSTWFIAIMILSMLFAIVSLVAMIILLLKAAKTRVFGPNVVYGFSEKPWGKSKTASDYSREIM